MVSTNLPKDVCTELGKQGKYNLQVYDGMMWVLQ